MGMYIYIHIRVYLHVYECALTQREYIHKKIHAFIYTKKNLQRPDVFADN